MMDFLTGQQLVYANKKYEGIYELFKSEYGIETAELFILCASIGYKYGRKVSFEKDTANKQFRSNYLKNLGRVTAYTIMLSDVDLNIDIDDFGIENKENYNKYIRVLEEYSEGGMDLLVEKVFRSKFISGNLDPNYRWYLVDVMNFVYSQVA